MSETFLQKLIDENVLTAFALDDTIMETMVARLAMNTDPEKYSGKGMIILDITANENAADDNTITIDRGKIPQGLVLDLEVEIEKYRDHFMAEHPGLVEDVPYQMLIGNMIVAMVLAINAKNMNVVVYLTAFLHQLFPDQKDLAVVIQEADTSDKTDRIFKLVGMGPITS